MIRTATLAILASTALAAFSAAAADAPATPMNGMLVGPNQMTLYVFDRDTAGSGKSACNGGCATNWPPLMAPKDAKAMGDWTVVTRDDGATMWAYKGKPLYTFIQDKKAGDVVGDGFAGGTWHIAKP